MSVLDSGVGLRERDRGSIGAPYSVDKTGSMRAALYIKDWVHEGGSLTQTSRIGSMIGSLTQTSRTARGTCL